MIRQEIVEYVEREIIPRYDLFDAAHRRDHVATVIEASMRYAKIYGVNEEMAYIVAAYHDTGLAFGRNKHHSESKRIILEDKALREWFSEEQIATMADATEDHRASSKGEPRTIYGRIVAEADRLIVPQTIIRRTVQYGLAHYPTLTGEEHFARCIEHLTEKYGEGGYLKLWIPHSENARQLEALRKIIADKAHLRELFETIFAQEQSAL